MVLKNRLPKPYSKGGGLRLFPNINGFWGRMMINQSVLHFSKLSGTFGVLGITVGGILPYLGLGKGRKITKIVEISEPLTPLNMTVFSTFF